MRAISILPFVFSASAKCFIGADAFYLRVSLFFYSDSVDTDMEIVLLNKNVMYYVLNFSIRSL